MAESDWLVPQWPAPAHVKAVFTTRAGGVSLVREREHEGRERVRTDAVPGDLLLQCVPAAVREVQGVGRNGA